jgi:hypothetical protein
MNSSSEKIGAVQQKLKDLSVSFDDTHEQVLLF